MKNYIFGLEATEYQGTGSEDFVLNHGGNATQGNNNPYHKEFLSNPENRATTNEEGRITSIPSPYARMHLTDLAFEEANCGIGVLSASERAAQELAPDYLKALSHCLDMFELMYHADEFNFAQKGISLHKLNLISTHTQDPAELAVLFKDGKLTPLGKYIKTLDLYRDAYLKTITERRAGAHKKFHFDFKSLYVFKYKGKVFAATSPFTGFFTKADCDLTDAGITINGNKLLSAESATWRDCRKRDRNFIEFLYLLLKEYNLEKTFENLYNSVEDAVKQDSSWEMRLNGATFATNKAYDKFNMSSRGLQQIPGTDVYIRPDGLDCSYLKFLLYLQNPVDLTIANEEYELPLEQRTFDGQFLKWIGVNDILSDALFVLPYDVNENYTVISYKDATRGNTMCRRCLVPIKSEILKYFSLKDLIENLSIVRNEQELFTVELKINLEGGNSVVLRREYHMDEELAVFPKGRLIQGSAMKPFAFGVYPFVKSTNELNIYKVLFYNVFGGETKLEFYHKDASGMMVRFLETEHMVNKTNDVTDESVPLNCEYHHLQHLNGFDFAELKVESKYTSLIIPCLRKIPTRPNSVNVAIDLGTSNTYIAYSVVNPMDPTSLDIREINTHHVTANNVQWNELTFMSMRCEPKDRPDGVNECNSDDLVVRLNDDAASKATSEMLDHQLCEFIPSRIDPSPINPNGEKSYRFPIPSVLNFLRVNQQRLMYDKLPDSNPLINTAIPFAYYERGMRQRPGAGADYYYDVISKGNTFKWFRTRNSRGEMEVKPGGEAAFKAFVRELLFIVRCHVLSEGYQLSNVNVYWSYPLSFDSALLDSYISEWESAFRDVIDRNSTGRVHYTCESRSPIYDCINPVNVKQLTLLVDIGGGSTDVIGYKKFEPLFVSSTKFAGNALYLCGDLNNEMIASAQGNKKTLMYKYVRKMNVLNATGVQNGGFVTQTIGLNEDMATIMNYGFAKYPAEFKQIFDNLPAEFMLKLHNSLLLYHIAQLSYAMSPDEAPSDIYLTGNGSKQLQMRMDQNAMIKKIFGYVYRQSSSVDPKACDRIGITFPMNPKAATAIGTLKGLNLKIALDADSIGDSYVAFGDGKSILRNDSMHGARITAECQPKNVMSNAMDFVEMFYSEIYTTPCPSVTKQDMIDTLKSCSVPETNSDNGLIDDSLFLRLMSEVMEKLSQKLAQ